jgi:proline iminopeptidase
MELKIAIKGKGYPILCLHGHPGRGSSLSVFTQPLSGRFQTLVPDLRGYGKSKALEAFQMGDHLNDLEQLLDRFGIKRCLLLGWSLGGILALELMLRQPDRFSGLILIASAARPYGNHPPITWQDLAMTGIAAGLNSLKPGWQWNIDRFGKRSLFRYLFAQQTPVAYHHLAQEGIPAYLQTSMAANRALAAALNAGYDRLNAISRLKNPCLILAGERDRHITASSSEITAKALENSVYHCYANTAHLFPWEIPQQVLADINRWLAERPWVVQD